MIPVIVDFGTVELFGRTIPLAINSFGLMIVISFLVSGWMVTLELKRRGIEPDHFEGYPMTALVGGIVGARLYWMFEHPRQIGADPLGSIFGGAGLTWYGGLILGAAATLFLAWRRKQSLWGLCDAFAPALAAAYGIGRIGCQLAGDGDYGPASDLPWAMGYPNGVVPTPPGVTVHPTPVYEILMLIPIVWILWKLRLRPSQPGWLFGIYLALVGIERWISEVFRDRSPDDLMIGMSTAQWISLLLIAAGATLAAMRRATPPPNAEH